MKAVHKNILLSAKGKPSTAQFCTNNAGTAQVCTIGAWCTKQPYMEQCCCQNTHPTCQRGAPLLTHMDARLKLMPADSVGVEQCKEGDRSRRSHHLCLGCLYRVLSALVTIFLHSWLLKIRIDQFSQDETNTWKAVLSYIPWFTKGNISGWHAKKWKEITFLSWSL